YYAGHFMKALARAYKNIIDTYITKTDGDSIIHESAIKEPDNVVLVIDEINRGNSASIFGTVFQLLDREKSGWSSYGVTISDLEYEQLLLEIGFENKSAYNEHYEQLDNTFKYNEHSGLSRIKKDSLLEKLYQSLNQHKGYTADDGSLVAIKERTIYMPNNLSLLASMNTSDNSVYFMDNAFKRRWDWEFINTEDSGAHPDIANREILLFNQDSKIDFIKTDKEHGRKTYSFVGLQRNRENENLEFWLPLGFENFDEKNFDNVKSFFFKMYRTFKIYSSNKLSSLREQVTSDRDGFIEAEEGFAFINKNHDESIFYGKLNSLDRILEGYDDLRIASIEKKESRDAIIDYTKIHRYMHKAMYIGADIIYLDEMNIAKNIISQEGPPILQIFSFIYVEIKKELEELNGVTERAFDLSEQFKNNYLQPDSSLFDENNFSETISVLKDILDDIDINTVYKDGDYWHFYEATEAFLYGERNENASGIYWGINNFYDVWEDMCQIYMLNAYNHENLILFADTNNHLKDYGRLGINPYQLRLNHLPNKRTIKPDLVLLKGFLSKGEKSLSASYTLREKKLNSKSYYTINWTNYLDMKTQHPVIHQIFTTYLAKNEDRQNPAQKGIRGCDIVDFEQEVENALADSVTINIPDGTYPLLTDVSDRFIIRIVDYKYMHLLDYESYSPTKGEQGKLRINLSWNTTDDLDLSVITPGGEIISYNSKIIEYQGIIGELDIDRNASVDIVSNPQENINWDGYPSGLHKVVVNFYKMREKEKWAAATVPSPVHSAESEHPSGSSARRRQRLAGGH
nr:hypothetical protein [Tanacetum cinerariifolium]